MMIAALACLGLAANSVSLSLAFGIDFIFGSVFALIALRTLGIIPAMVVAAIAASYTYILWGHPYAWLIFTLEVLSVGLLQRNRWIHSLVVADAVYWLLLGIPLIWFTYGYLLGVPGDQVWLISLKQPLNGITNAILASLLMLILPGEWLNRHMGLKLDPRVGIREWSFTMIITIVYLSVVFMLVQQSRSMHAMYENEIERGLQDHAEEINLYIRNDGEQFDIDKLARIFTPTGGRDEHGIIILRSDGHVLKSTISNKNTSILVAWAQSHKQSNKLQIYQPDRKSMPLMVWWNSSIYFLVKNIDDNGIRSVIITQPTKFLISKIHRYNSSNLALLVAVLIVAMLVAMIVSKRFSRTILRLVDVTDDLPNKLRKGQVVDWPKSMIRELDTLSYHASVMSQNIQDTINGYVSSQQALTERMRFTSEALDENNARSAAIIEGSAEGIITISEYGVIESFNVAAEGMFGYRANEIIGSNISMLLPESYHDAYNGYLSEHRKDNKPRAMGSRHEVEGRRKDGTIFPMELSVSEIRLKDRRIFTGFVIDISERKEAERLKNEFISTVSHELRTPLTAIRGAIGLLSAKESTSLSDKARHLLDITLNNTQRLVRLINDILDIQKLEAGGMNFALSKERLLPIVDTVVAENQSYVAQFDIGLKLEASDNDICIMTNIDRMNQVLTNLISNAAKFSPPGSVVGVSVIRDGKMVRVEVEDHGVGIADEFRDRIFEKFSQADGSSTRRTGGTGLGLSISKGFVEHMGGQIDFRTRQGEGTVFFVSFPVCPC